MSLHVLDELTLICLRDEYLMVKPEMCFYGRNRIQNCATVYNVLIILRTS